MNDNRTNQSREKALANTGYLLLIGMIMIAVSVSFISNWKWGLLTAGIELVIIAFLVCVGRAMRKPS